MTKKYERIFNINVNQKNTSQDHMKFCLHIINWKKRRRMRESNKVWTVSVTEPQYIAGESINCYNCFGKQSLSPVAEYFMPKYIPTIEHMYKNAYKNNS